MDEIIDKGASKSQRNLQRKKRTIVIVIINKVHSKVNRIVCFHI